ncbi:hypothetical protein [Selenomonas noxia]|nr:hypothetical protein [Selenomonas noxia]
MRYEQHGCNVLAPAKRRARMGNFFLNLGWSFCWLVRSGVRLLK